VWSARQIASSVDLLWRYANLESVQVVRDDGVDVKHDQPFEAFHGYRCECHGAIDIGHRDWIRERLKMSLKTLACWSVHAPSTRPGNPSGPAAL
jgi:hypothetical protein